LTTWYHFNCRKLSIATSNNTTKQIGEIIVADFVQLNDKTDAGTVIAKIKDVVISHFTDENTLKHIKPEVFIHPMAKWRLYSEFENGKNTGGFIKYVKMFGF